jgi:hypothetical protein
MTTSAAQDQLKKLTDNFIVNMEQLGKDKEGRTDGGLGRR